MGTNWVEWEYNLLTQFYNLSLVFDYKEKISKDFKFQFQKQLIILKVQYNKLIYLSILHLFLYALKEKIKSFWPKKLSRWRN